jgi:signal transduction histidine kinase
MRMAVSYVLVTAAAVVLVDGVVLGVLLPRILAGSTRASAAGTVADVAGTNAKLLTEAAAGYLGQAPAGTTGGQILARLVRGSEVAALGLATTGAPGGWVKACMGSGKAEALISPDGTVLASNRPASCAPGLRLSFASKLASRGSGSFGIGASGDQVVWAVMPVADVLSGKGRQPSPTGSPFPAAPTPGQGSPAGQSSPAGKYLPVKHLSSPVGVIGGVYVQEPVTPGVSFAQVRPLLVTGGLVLALVIPVGTVFGLLSTRRVIRRIERLAEVTGAVADGDFRPRVPVSGGDEIGRLEDAFNRMAGRLSTAVDQERLRAGADARQAERARIARELHDSISQDLFSLSLLGAGLRKALRANPALRPEVEAMERTANRAMREMQALLLELRPVALEDAGLVPAIAELCQAYQARLGIKVTAELGEVSLDPAAEHAVLRVIQEALGNAARHGQPETIRIGVGQSDGYVTVEVRDDGRGFDPTAIAERHGMGLTLMRERVTELGGDLRLDAAPGEGAAIAVRLPAGRGSRP